MTGIQGALIDPVYILPHKGGKGNAKFITVDSGQ